MSEERDLVRRLMKLGTDLEVSDIRSWEDRLLTTETLEPHVKRTNLGWKWEIWAVGEDEYSLMCQGWCFRRSEAVYQCLMEIDLREHQRQGFKDE